MAIGWQLTFEL